MTDLFGADLPVEGAEGGVFAWRDGPLLQALKSGSWIVLDEVRDSNDFVALLCNVQTGHIRLGLPTSVCSRLYSQTYVTWAPL